MIFCELILLYVFGLRPHISKCYHPVFPIREFYKIIHQLIGEVCRDLTYKFAENIYLGSVRVRYHRARMCLFVCILQLFIFSNSPSYAA